MKKTLFYALPAAVGIASGAGILMINPEVGSTLGSVIYSQGQEKASYAYAVNRAAPSVVNIYVATLNHDYSGQSTGTITTSASGVIMTSTGYIVTNYHVIPSVNAPNTSIFAQSRDGNVYQAFIVGYDRRTDIAVLKIEGQNLPPIPVDPDEDVQVGDVVLAIGNPNNLGQTVTHGIVSATARSGSGLLTREQMNIREGLQDLIQTDAPINLGNSGGALIDTTGNMVGINTASFNSMRYGTYGIGFAVPTKLVTYVMNEIIKHGRVIRGYLGISDDGAAQLPDSQEIGVRVGYIDPFGPAAGTDLRVGDYIVSVNGKSVDSVRALIDEVSGSAPGTELKFTVNRNGQELIIPVVLAEDRPNVD